MLASLETTARPLPLSFVGGSVRRMLKLFAILFVTSTALVHSRVAATSRAESLSADKGVFLMRVIASAEHPTADRSGYLNLADLLSTPGLSDAAKRQQDGLPDIQMIDSSSGAVLNYVVQVTTSDDKKHFQGSLEPTDPRTCLPAIFADDRGVFYVGKGLGCPSSGNPR